jgi:hypothetical protein
LEEAGVDLAEDVLDGLGFVGEFYGKGVLELGVEAGDHLGAEGLEVAEGQEHADVLGRLA